MGSVQEIVLERWSAHKWMALQSSVLTDNTPNVTDAN